MMPSEDSTSLVSLQEGITRVRRERMAAQRNAGQRGVVDAALAAARQDRDSLTSPEVERLRAHSQNLIDRLLEAWAAVDSIRVLVARHDAAGVTTSGTVRGRALLDALAEEEAERCWAKEALAGAGIVAEVPEPALLKAVRAHPNQEGIAAVLESAAEESLAREARAAQPTRSRTTNTETRPRGSHGPR